MSKIKFKEQHSFRAIGILGLLAFLIIGLAVKFADPVFWNSMTDSGNAIVLVSSWVFLIGAFVYFWLVKYTLRVNEKGISYQYFPKHDGRNKIKWEEIDNCEVVQTPLMMEMSGWNVQFSEGENYSLSGRNGLEVTLKNGERVFLGAKNLSRLKEVIAKFKSA